MRWLSLLTVRDSQHSLSRCWRVTSLVARPQARAAAARSSGWRWDAPGRGSRSRRRSACRMPWPPRGWRCAWLPGPVAAWRSCPRRVGLPPQPACTVGAGAAMDAQRLGLGPGRHAAEATLVVTGFACGESAMYGFGALSLRSLNVVSSLITFRIAKDLHRPILSQCNCQVTPITAGLWLNRSRSLTC